MLYNPNQRKLLLLGVIACLGIFIVFALRDFAIAIIGSVIVYTIFKPWYISLTKRKKWNPHLTALMFILLSFIIIVLPFFSLIWMLVGKIMLFRDNPSAINTAIAKIDYYMGVNFNQPDLVPNTLNKVKDWLAGSFPSAVSRVLHILLMVLVMYFMLFFMFIHHEFFEKMILKYVPLPEKNSLHLGTEFKNVTYASVLGHGVIAISQGILFGLGFLIFGIPDPFFWGVVIMMFAFIPLIGPPVVIIPTALFTISSGNTFGGIGIMIYGLFLVSLVEYFLRFYISRKVGKIHPIITVLGLIIGLPFFGVLGLVIGPLIVSFFVLLVELYETNYMENGTVKRKKVVEIQND